MSIYTSGHQLITGGGMQFTVTTASTTVSAVMPTGTTGIYLTSSTSIWIDHGASASIGKSLHVAASATPFWLPIAAGQSITAKAWTVNGTLMIAPTCD